MATCVPSPILVDLLTFPQTRSACSLLHVITLLSTAAPKPKRPLAAS